MIKKFIKSMILVLTLSMIMPIYIVTASTEIDSFSVTKGRNRWDIQLTADEVELLARIVQLECGHDIRDGKYATIETIFNRIKSEKFPNTLEEVLSQKGQFGTWRNRNIEQATPNLDTYEAIFVVLNGQTNVLGFDRLKFNNVPIGYHPIKIGGQYYGK